MSEIKGNGQAIAESRDSLHTFLLEPRASWSMVLACLLLSASMPTELDENLGLKLLGRLDAAREVFWSLIVCAGLGLTASFVRRGFLKKTSGMMQWMILAAVTFWLVMIFSRFLNDDRWVSAYKIAEFFVFINVLSLAAAAVSTETKGPLFLICRIPILGEGMLPLGFWACRRRSLLPGLRLPVARMALPMTALYTAAALFALIGMTRADWRPEAWPYRENILWSRESYGLVFDAGRRMAIASAFTDGIVVVDTTKDEVRTTVALPNGNDLSNLACYEAAGLVYAVDAEGELFAVDPIAGRASSMGSFGFGKFGLAITAGVSPDGNWLWISSDRGGPIMRLDPKSLGVAASGQHAEGTLTDLLKIDEQSLLYSLSLDGALVELGLYDLKFRRSLMVEPNSARMAYDSVTDRLLITVPPAAKVLVVNRAKLRVEQDVPAMMGCRALAILPKERLLFVAGFAPYLEIFDLDSFKLLGRIRCPSWVRNIAVDPASNLAVLTDKHIGVTSFDYSETVRRGRNKRDPFFVLAREIGLWMEKRRSGPRPPP